MKTNEMKFLVCVLVVLAVTFSGCKKVRTYVPVSGSVVLDGSPVEGATVAFLPLADDGASASGRTDVSGNFTLASGADPGCIPGEYQITVIKIDSKFVQDAKAGPLGGKMVTGKNQLPKQYSVPETSGLTATVTKGGAPVQLELKK